MSDVDYSAPPQPCIYCGDPTDFGSGKFVNRVPAGGDFRLPDGTTEHRDGYACEECIEEIGCETPEGDVCRECIDIAGTEYGPDCIPFWLDEAREAGKRRECVRCNSLIWDPSWDSDTP